MPNPITLPRNEKRKHEIHFKGNSFPSRSQIFSLSNKYNNNWFKMRRAPYGACNKVKKLRLMVRCKFVVGVLFARVEWAKMDYTSGLLQGFAPKLRVDILKLL